MIEHKSTMLAVYFLLLIVACSLPFVLLARRTAVPSKLPSILLGAGLGASAIGLLWVRVWPGPLSPVVAALPMIAPLLRLGVVPLLGGLCAVSLFAGVTWWDADLQLTTVQATVFILLGALALSWPQMSLPRKLPRTPVVLSVFAVIGVLAALPMGQFETPAGFHTLWHHWGAYVSPAEALLAGGVPFRDFPIQYGFGPTLLIGALCGDNCYQGMYVAALAANVLYLVALGGCVLALTRHAAPWLAWLALVAMLPATLLWTGFPPDEMGSLVAPSVAGLRYFPIVLLLWHVLDQDGARPRSDARGHALWFFSLAWSPEAAFFATAVWWPWLALRAAQAIEKPTLRAVIIRSVQVGLIAIGALMVGLSVLAIVFRFAFHNWPSIDGLLTYIRNPPGMLPPNFFGPLPLALATIALLALTMLRSDPNRVRQGMACLIALIAVGSYYIGRSHDNNLLNLFPFVLLALTAALAAGLPSFLSASASVFVAGMIAWPASFGSSLLQESWRNGSAGHAGPLHILRLMKLDTPQALALVDHYVTDPRAPASDASEALAWLRAQHDERPILINDLMVLPPGRPGAVWTGMNNLGNFALLPPDVIRQFIAQGAASFQRPGWLLIDTAFKGPWLHYFAESYSIGEQRAFGGYIAYRMIPRTAGHSGG